MFLEKHFDAFMLKDIGVPYFGAGILAGLVLFIQEAIFGSLPIECG